MTQLALDKDESSGLLEIATADCIMRIVNREAYLLENKNSTFTKDDYFALEKLARTYATLKDNMREDLKSGLLTLPG